MNSTSAADVIIQALWPGPAVPSSFELTLASAASEPRVPLLTYASRSATRCCRSGSAFLGGAAAAVAAAVAFVTADATCVLASAAVKTPPRAAASNKAKNIFFIWGEDPFYIPLNRVFTFFFRPDTDGFVDRGNEDFAIANLSSLCRPDDGRDRGFHAVVRDHHLDLDLGEEIDRVFAATIDLRVTFLTTEALNFAHRHAFNAHVSEGILNLFQFERFYDCFDFLHSFCANRLRPRRVFCGLVLRRTWSVSANALLARQRLHRPIAARATTPTARSRWILFAQISGIVLRHAPLAAAMPSKKSGVEPLLKSLNEKELS